MLVWIWTGKWPQLRFSLHLSSVLGMEVDLCIYTHNCVEWLSLLHNPHFHLIIMWHVYHSQIWWTRVVDQGVSAARQCFITLFSYSDIALNHIAILIILYNWFCSLYVHSCTLVSVVLFVWPYRCSEWWDCSSCKALCTVSGHEALQIETSVHTVVKGFSLMLLCFFPRLELTSGPRERERSWATFWPPWERLLPRKTNLLLN